MKFTLIRNKVTNAANRTEHAYFTICRSNFFFLQYLHFYVFTRFFLHYLQYLHGVGLSTFIFQDFVEVFYPRTHLVTGRFSKFVQQRI